MWSYLTGEQGLPNPKALRIERETLCLFRNDDQLNISLLIVSRIIVESLYIFDLTPPESYICKSNPELSRLLQRITGVAYLLNTLKLDFYIASDIARIS